MSGNSSLCSSCPGGSSPDALHLLAPVKHAVLLVVKVPQDSTKQQQHAVANHTSDIKRRTSAFREQPSGEAANSRCCMRMMVLLLPAYNGQTAAFTEFCLQACVSTLAAWRSNLGTS